MDNCRVASCKSKKQGRGRPKAPRPETVDKIKLIRILSVDLNLSPQSIYGSLGITHASCYRILNSVNPKFFCDHIINCQSKKDKLISETMTTLIQHEQAGVLRVALCYYLSSLLTSNITGNNINNTHGSNMSFNINSLNKVFNCYFAHSEINEVFLADENFNLLCEKVKKSIQDKFPDEPLQTVFPTLSSQP